LNQIKISFLTGIFQERIPKENKAQYIVHHAILYIASHRMAWHGMAWHYIKASESVLKNKQREREREREREKGLVIMQKVLRTYTVCSLSFPPVVANQKFQLQFQNAGFFQI
jgi:hypothetical protein